MKLKYQNTYNPFMLLTLLFIFLFVINPFGIIAQDSNVSYVEDSVYLDSLYDVIIEYIYKEKDYKKSNILVKKGLRKVTQESYNFYKFSYFDALIKKSEGQNKPALLLFSSIIKGSSSKSDPRFRYLIGLCHTKLAEIYVEEHKEKQMEFHCESALSSFSIIDFYERSLIHNLQYKYYKLLESDSTKIHLHRKLINSLKQYIYILSHFPSIKEKDQTYNSLAISFSELAYDYEYNNDFINAKKFCQLSIYFEGKSSKINQHNKIIDQYNLSYINFYLKDYRQSELLAKDIISSNAALDVPDAEIESGCLKLLGDIRIEKKDYIDALKYYEKAIAIADSTYNGKNSDIQYFHEGIARIHYELKNYDRAIEEYKKAVKATGNDTGKNKLNYLIGLAECYTFSDKNLALLYFDKALGIIDNVSEIQKIEATARINHKKGTLESSKAKAYPYHELARKAGRESQYPIESASENLIRMAGFNLDNEAVFLSLMEEAIAANLTKGKEYKSNEIPSHQDIVFPISLLRCYHYLGDFFKGKNQEKALEYYLMAKKLIAIIKPMYRYENSKSALIQESIPIYEKIIAISAEMYENNHNIQYFKWAYDATEKSKSIQLNDVINDYKAIGSAGVPDSLFEYGQSIKTQIAYHKERLNTSDQNLSEKQVNDINNTIVELNTKYDDYIVSIENDFPEYYELKYSITPIDIYKIQTSLTEQDLVLNYHIQDEFLIILTISKDTFSLIKEKIKQEKIETHVKDLMDALYARNKNDLKMKSQKLYDILLRKSLKENNQINHLIITPDGVLNYLSFEILPENDRKDSQVIYSKSVVYNYSSAQVIKKELI